MPTRPSSTVSMAIAAKSIHLGDASQVPGRVAEPTADPPRTTHHSGDVGYKLKSLFEPGLVFQQDRGMVVKCARPFLGPCPWSYYARLSGGMPTPGTIMRWWVDLD